MLVNQNPITNVEIASKILFSTLVIQSDPFQSPMFIVLTARSIDALNIYKNLIKPALEQKKKVVQ